MYDILIIENEREVMVMTSMYKTFVEKVCCVCSNPCLYYHKVYHWFLEDRVSEEVWNKFCMACLENLMEKNKEVLDNLKNV